MLSPFPGTRYRTSHTAVQDTKRKKRGHTRETSAFALEEACQARPDVFSRGSQGSTLNACTMM
jgi:hypothetical protein